MIHHREEFSRQTNARVFLRLHFLIGPSDHLDATEDQKPAQNIKDPVEAMHQFHPNSNHDSPHHHGAENPPKENPMLKVARNTEVRKNQGNDKDIVHGKSQLNDIARDELSGCFTPHPSKQHKGKPHGEGKPQKSPRRRFACVDLS